MNLSKIIKDALPRLECEEDFSFAKHTTIGCGGTAALSVSPLNIEEAAECLAFLEREGIPYCFLGAGANVLPRDGRFEGAAVRFNRMNKIYSVGNLIYAGAGVTGGALLSFAKESCVTGFEPFAGIPTTVGGGVAMNAGIAVRHFSDLVDRVVAVKSGKIETLGKDECAFSEKSSLFLSGVAVAGVYFRAQKADAEEIEKNTKLFLERRKHLPKGRSMGCTFVNPQSVPAGELIEKCGLKGKRVGGAYVSRQHANFIINEGTRSEDVEELICGVKTEVQRKTGILLKEEIRRIP